jgi:hypothetical protein
MDTPPPTGRTTAKHSATFLLDSLSAFIFSSPSDMLFSSLEVAYYDLAALRMASGCIGSAMAK